MSTSLDQVTITIANNQARKLDFDLMPGDIIITEMPFEDDTIEDFKPVKDIQQFLPGHVAIWTGSEFTKPLAHSVYEGYKLPGVRLTNIGDGRHVIFRLKNQTLAEKISAIARCWSSSVSVFDFNRFDKVYPKRYWDSPAEYEQHKIDFFAIPESQVYGPATPYNFERASLQKFHRLREPRSIEFTDGSLLRAIKFSARSEVMGPISTGMRCTSFVASVIQAASLAELTKKTAIKTSFSHYKNMSFNQFADIVLVDNWLDSNQGRQLQQAIDTQDFTKIFPGGFNIDSKYALPQDVLVGISEHVNDWTSVGSFSSHNGQIFNQISPDLRPLIEESKSNRHDMFLNLQLKLKKKIEELESLKEQIGQEQECTTITRFFATPQKKTSRPSDHRNLSSVTRKLW